MATVTVEKSDLAKLAEFTENTHWLLENIENLRPKYAGRYIAVIDSGRTLLDASSLEELNNVIIRYGKSPETCAIDFVTKEPYLLIL